MTGRQRRRARKAALLAAFSYICILTGGIGMLKAAQKTRQILYGGQPVMAQLHSSSVQNGTQTVMELGGGEWRVPLPDYAEEKAAAAEYAAEMPPCTLKYLLRLALLAENAADYTAGCIASGSVCSFSFRS